MIQVGDKVKVTLMDDDHCGRIGTVLVTFSFGVKVRFRDGCKKVYQYADVEK